MYSTKRCSASRDLAIEDIEVPDVSKKHSFVKYSQIE